MKARGTAIVVSPAGGTNVMGRVLSLSVLLEMAVDRVIVFTSDTGPLWAPANRWQAEIRRGGDPGTTFADLDPDEVRWVWMVKPLHEGYSAAVKILETFTEAKLILDVDDDDEALSREFVARSPLNWLRLAASRPRRQLLPGSVAKTRKRAIVRADGLTAATQAVADRCGLPQKQTFRIVHPRHVAAEERRRATDRSGIVHLGFFGTVRAHKGTRSIAELIASDSNLRLHLFTGYDPSGFESVKRQIVEHPVDEDQASQFEAVDLVLLPQESTPAGDVQLPAKLMDAMRFGVPILATPTTAIKEVAKDTLNYLDSWDDPSAALAAIYGLLEGNGLDGSAARRLFEQKLSIEATVPGVRRFLDSTSARADRSLS